VRATGAENIDEGKTELATMNETIRTQQELLKANATTQTEAENATREAHEEAMKAVKELEPEIQKNIAALNEMGDNQGAKKLAADFKLLQTQVAYVDPLVQQITTGLENSFANRGEQAIESIAQAFGKVITGQEKFKDLLGDTGPCVRQFHRRRLGGCRQDHHQIRVAESHQGRAGGRAGRRCGRRCGGWLAGLVSAKVPVAAAAAAGAASAQARSGTVAGSRDVFEASHWSLVLSTRRRHCRRQRHVARGGPIGVPRCAAVPQRRHGAVAR
jgi:hypothetical protein